MEEVPVARLRVAKDNQYPSQTTLGNFYIAACRKITIAYIHAYKNCLQTLAAIRSLPVYLLSRYRYSRIWMM
ncbi:hypothetical protein K3152_02550 [Qipengyuania sp. 1NDH17]|uniref:Uncharacterized protein n=1 Tax=Qipengyuania polymorpha TaxID=2867234 RepID=A0ABS7IUS9_9SPHN|nr:hypothetical protein [Qipengyuania polymorpha]MBX7457115.1 hypothetical protein [Qipengyuania polymorpha]